MYLSFFFFLLIFLLICHFFVYYLLLKIFNVNNKKVKLKLALLIITLFLAVFITLYLFNRYDHALIRLIYIIFASWMGIALNIIFLASLFLFFKKILNIFRVEIKRDYFIYSFLGLLIIIISLSFYRAFIPRISSYEVFIENLPLGWENKKIVHVSDLHLGPIYRANFLNRIIKKINTLNPEAVFISGDFFDGRKTDFSWLNHLLDSMKVNRGIFYSFGNHDLYLGADQVKAVINNEDLVILDDKIVTIDDLQIIGINYLNNGSNELVLDVLKENNYNEGKASILMFHAPQNILAFKEAKIDLQLSGHTHDGQLFPFNYLVKWFHQGYGYGFFNEGDFNLVVSSGLGTWGPPMRIAKRSEIVEIVLRKK